MAEALELLRKQETLKQISMFQAVFQESPVTVRGLDCGTEDRMAVGGRLGSLQY